MAQPLAALSSNNAPRQRGVKSPCTRSQTRRALEDAASPGELEPVTTFSFEVRIMHIHMELLLSLPPHLLLLSALQLQLSA